MKFKLRSKHILINDEDLFHLFGEKWRYPKNLEYSTIEDKYQQLKEYNEDKPPIINMKRLYRYTYNSNGRYTQWMTRALAAAIRAEALSQYDIDERKVKYIKFLHVSQAMVLLTYGANATRNRQLIIALSNYTGVPIPPPKRPRAEDSFALDLAKEINNMDGHYNYTLEQQVKIGEHKVDFLITVLRRLAVIERFILEFDEAYHQTTRQQRKDKQRDNQLRELGYKIIRVNESEAKKWLEISCGLNYPFHRASVISDCINDAIKVHPRTKKRYISTESALASVNSAVETEIIDDTKQTLNQMAKLLDMQKIPYLRTKMLENGKEKRVLRLEN